MLIECWTHNEEAQLRAVPLSVTMLCKLFTYMCLCYQALFGAGQKWWWSVTGKVTVGLIVSDVVFITSIAWWLPAHDQVLEPIVHTFTFTNATAVTEGFPREFLWANPPYQCVEWRNEWFWTVNEMLQLQLDSVVRKWSSSVKSTWCLGHESGTVHCRRMVAMLYMDLSAGSVLESQNQQTVTSLSSLVDLE